MPSLTSTRRRRSCNRPKRRLSRLQQAIEQTENNLSILLGTKSRSHRSRVDRQLSSRICQRFQPDFPPLC